MKRSRKTSRGFSIVELLMGMLASSILALAIGSVMVYVWTGWVRNSASVEMQRDSTLAMRTIAREIRRTPVQNIDDGVSLTCLNTNGTFVFTESGRNLIRQQGGSSIILARGILIPGSFDSKVNPDESVTVNMTLNTGADISKNTMTVYTRN